MVVLCIFLVEWKREIAPCQYSRSCCRRLRPHSMFTYRVLLASEQVCPQNQNGKNIILARFRLARRGLQNNQHVVIFPKNLFQTHFTGLVGG